MATRLSPLFENSVKYTYLMYGILGFIAEFSVLCGIFSISTVWYLRYCYYTCRDHFQSVWVVQSRSTHLQLGRPEWMSGRGHSRLEIICHNGWVLGKKLMKLYARWWHWLATTAAYHTNANAEPKTQSKRIPQILLLTPELWVQIGGDASFKDHIEVDSTNYWQTEQLTHWWTSRYYRSLYRQLGQGGIWTSAMD